MFVLWFLLLLYNTMAKSNFGSKEFIWLTDPDHGLSLSVIAGTQDWICTLEAGTLFPPVLLTGLVHLACLACFLIPSSISF